MACFVRDSFMVGKFDGVKKLAVELIADEESDLPAYNGWADGELTLGSIALIVKSGELCALSSDGKWYRQSDGSEVTS